MARATAVPTAASSTRRATLDRTRVKNVTLSSLPMRTSYARSGTVVVGNGFVEARAPDDPAAGVGRGGRRLADGSASCCWRTWAGGGPRRTSGVAV